MDYKKEYKKSIASPEKFWAEQAKSFVWKKPWTKVYKGELTKGTGRWFTGAKLNITENCLDRHLPNRANDIALIWEPNEPTEKSVSFSYAELYDQVCKMANVLKGQGVKKGDYVCIYLPMIPQAVFAMLACARIGAIHNVVFGGFSAQSLADRINDCGAKIVITSDVGYRGVKEIPIKKIVDEAIALCPNIEKVLVAQRGKLKINLSPRDVMLDTEMKIASTKNEPVTVDAVDPLFVLYTSGSTGKPKGLVHGTAGYMVYANYTFKRVFDYKPGEIYWCTADVGWITGHSYAVYGPLSAGATVVIFEGVPTYPTPSRFWEVIEKHKVNIFYTAPTVIRSLQSLGEGHVKKFKMKSLRLIGSVGETLNASAWQWYHKYVGKDRCHIVDTWWQTETGGILLSPQIGLEQKPGSVGSPMPGIVPAILDAKGKEIKDNKSFGALCIKKPWPGMAMTILNDPKRFVRTYLSAFNGYYQSGDAAKRDKDGYFTISGRMDDVMNISAHRIGCAEVESAINFHPHVAESSVVSHSHPIKGEEIYAFVVLSKERLDVDVLRVEILRKVEEKIGPIARPGKIQVVKELPKTRSGKIIRRILRRLAAGESCEGEDLTTLTNQDSVVAIREGILTIATK